MEEKEVWEQITPTGDFPDPEPEHEEEANESEPSEIEQKAMEKGWVPEDQWHGEPEDWRPAKEFMDRSSFFERINNQNREISALKRDIEMAKEHMNRIRKAYSEGSTSQLEQQKIEALEEGDYRKVTEIDKQMRALEQESEPEHVNDENPEINPEFQEWVSDNPWYNTDSELRADADAFGISFRQNNPDALPHDVFSYVSKKVRQLHPSKFGTATSTPQSQTPNNATNPVNPRRGSKVTYRDLNEEQLRVGRRFVKHGLYKDVQEYVDDLVAAGDL